MIREIQAAERRAGLCKWQREVIPTSPPPPIGGAAMMARGGAGGDSAAALSVRSKQLTTVVVAVAMQSKTPHPHLSAKATHY